MSTLTVSVLTSLDGYQEAAGGDLTPMPFDDTFSPHNLRLIEAADVLLMGRRGYEDGAAYWPHVQDDPEQPEVERTISRRNTAMEKVVVSDTLELDPDGAWTPTTRVVPRSAAPGEVRRLKASGRRILMFGGATTWSPLLEAGLVDEIVVLVGPALLGDGVPLYAGGRVALTLRSAATVPDSQLVELHYAPAAP